MKQDYKLTVEVNSSHLSDAALTAMIGSIEQLVTLQLQKTVENYDTQVMQVFRSKAIDISLTAVKL